MNPILKKIRNFFFEEKRPTIRVGNDGFKVGGNDIETRSFGAAIPTNATADWPTVVTSADAEMRNDLGTLRTRARQLERDNDYVPRYLKLLENNVIGADGIGLHMEIKAADGTLDTKNCGLVETAWSKWGRRDQCTISKDWTFDELCRMGLRSCARDGAALFIKVTGPAAGNDFGFALKPMEADHIDRFYSGYAPNGNEVRLGIEFDDNKKRVAYWITPRHPGDYLGYSGNYTRKRIDAKDVIHLFRRNRFEQSDGVPWLASAMVRLNHLGKYEEAEVIAARVGACKEAYIQMQNGEEYKGDGVDANGNQVSDMEPGAVKVLPVGATLIPNNPTHPTNAFPDFVKAMLRGIASGLGVSYNSLANDLENVNYSSIRAGLLEEREEWKMIQNWFITDFCMEVFEAWLPFALLSGQIALPFSKLEQINKPGWKARRWSWVDPLKDMEAAILASNNYLASPQAILSEQGKDPETLLKEIAEWKKMIEDAGLPPITEAPPTPKTADAPPVQEPETPPKPPKKNNGRLTSLFHTNGHAL